MVLLVGWRASRTKSKSVSEAQVPTEVVGDWFAASVKADEAAAAAAVVVVAVATGGRVLDTGKDAAVAVLVGNGS
jgi:hypothetical protein